VTFELDEKNEKQKEGFCPQYCAKLDSNPKFCNECGTKLT